MNYKLIILLLSIAIFGCKKEKNSPDADNQNVTVNNPIYPGGELRTLVKQFSNGAASGQEDSLAYAYFFNINAPGVYANAGNVIYNGVTLQNQVNEYQDTTFLINLHQANSVWNIGGSPAVSAFSHTFNPSFPVFSGAYLLPDSVSRSSTTIVNLGNTFTNVNDSITITIEGGNSTSKKIAPGQTSCTFTAADMALLNTGNGNIIKIEFANKHTANYTNKIYNVYNCLWHTKYGVKILP